MAEQLQCKGENQEEQVVDQPSHHVLEINQVTNKYHVRVPLLLSFVDLTYTVNEKRRIQLSHLVPENGFTGTKTLIDNISGEAQNGELLAVLGASGSGKSTFIDALANRIAKGSLKGSITLNGEPIGGKLMKVISSYVMQHDLLFPMLTVQETLMFSAEFRLPNWFSKSKKKERVEALIDRLGLRTASKTVIGEISSGERRRVSIGIDIIHDPIILFLDEPTSSLDSSSALMVIQVLKKIAETGSIVILSIHQPSYRILNLLDRLIILSCGRSVYSGSPRSLPLFLSEYGTPVPENESYIEFALDLIKDLERNPEEIKRLIGFAKKRNHLPIAKKHNCGQQEALTANGNENTLLTTFANSMCMEIAVLTNRSIKNMIRKPSILITQLALITVTGLFISALFWNMGSSAKGVQERLGFFAFVLTLTFFITSDALPALLMERDIFNRETAHNAYRHSSYVITTTLLSIPHSLLLSLAFCTVTFSAVGLAGGYDGFLYFFLTMFSSLWAGTSFISFLSGVVSNVLLGNTVGLGCLGFFLLVSGFFVNRNSIPKYLIWFHYLSAFKYPYEGLMQSEFRATKECFSVGFQVFDNMALTAMNSSAKESLLGCFSREEGVNITDSTCMITGLEVLRDQGITGMGKWECLCMALAWGMFFRVMFYWALRVGNKNKRR